MLLKQQVLRTDNPKSVIAVLACKAGGDTVDAVDFFSLEYSTGVFEYGVKYNY